MRVDDVLQDKNDQPLITVRAAESLRDAIGKLDHERIGATLVVNDAGHLVGMLSERDLIGVLAEYGERALKANVGALMTRRVYACRPDDALADAMAWMVRYRVRHLPVVEDGRVRGLISIGDAVKHLGKPTDVDPMVLEDAGVRVGAG